MATDRNSETAILPSPVLPEDESPAGSPPNVRVDFGAMSHPGRVRTNNEDHYLISRISRTLHVLKTNVPAAELPDRMEDFGHVLVVADGMGGMAGGEQASRLAILTGVRLVFDSPKWTFRIDEQEAQELITRMTEFFQKVDAVLIENGREGRGLAGMGTTLTVAYTAGTQAFIFHAGDSRAYLYRGGKLSQVTRDHTVAQLLADSGEIDPEAVATHTRRHVLTNFAGGSTSGIVPEIDIVGLKDGDRLLMCSDGLTEMVDDGTIAETLAEHSDPQAASRALVQHALKRGGRDNVTVLVARYHITPSDSDRRR
jgi:protein phosphatase